MAYSNGASQQSGIWVTGTGKVAVQPDLALLNLGIEARANTVSGARQQAAEAMSRVVQAMKADGLQEKDIQTRYFNIQPQYVWNDFAKRQEITGYLVSNNVTTKVRNLDALGSLIDKMVEAGGDLIRVQGISFTVEEPVRYQNQAREAAVKDAMATAQQFAALTGVSLGKPIYIAQVGGVSPVIKEFSRMEVGIATTPAPTTPISAGELDVQVQVQIVFDIK
ncbi:MAG: SIMPL domain-containing protein [Chloroflexi bacterium]|nr:SIMPL domain-containing protein [Chloroflexota bacterium]